MTRKTYKPAYLKLVPNDEPNADGQWVMVERRESPFSKLLESLSTKLVDSYQLYADDVPEGHHIVQITHHDPGKDAQ